ncbi:RNA polymerase sigma-70 factor [Arenibacter sp. 6A1]|uniref:RNA polymerase sigma-70 factor n=1 Tax=Arenibacter sp. 6A1 TaxID=2720391 RepID=UPI0014473412|nr:RNA polymerase sigma-70 factor [Arenibacter sp. 6A1]NKI28403.1 RNA polymerase sigma-70 factor [Arenibacter sp. 6A1]
MKFSSPSDTSNTERLFKEHYSLLCLYSFSVVKDHEVAKDIVQDFFISYWQKEDELTITNSFKAYATRAVKNLSLRYLEQQRKQQRLLQQLPINDYEEITEEETPIEKNKIPELLDQLPESRRDIFISYVLDGMSYAEIAAHNDISINTVKTQMKRAYAFLRTNSTKDWLHILLVVSTCIVNYCVS